MSSAVSSVHIVAELLPVEACCVRLVGRFFFEVQYSALRSSCDRALGT